MAMVPDKLLRTSRPRWISWLADGFGWSRARVGQRYLDVRDLSPHLLRDMGFLDGNDPDARCR